MAVGDIITTDREVVAIPDFILRLIETSPNSNEFWHPTKTALLKAQQDPDGDWIIGINALTNPDWDFLGEDENGDSIDFTNPETGFTDHLVKHLVHKKYKYIETEI